MGVVNTKATLIGNADSVPPTLTNSHMNGYLREMPGTVEVAAADSDGSVYRLVRVPSNAEFPSLRSQTTRSLQARRLTWAFIRRPVMAAPS
jgi:hypothetical protein